MFLTPFQKRDTRNVSEAELQQLVDENRKIYSEFFDPEYLNSIIRNICKFFDKHYFRIKFIGFDKRLERNDPERPLIYASNHSGMAFPWDAMMFGAGFLRLNDFDMKRSVRGLAAPMLSQTKLMQPYLIDDLWKRSGGVDATTLNFETMMSYQGSDLLIYPEGVPGIGKGFNKKYKLQRFSTSFIRMSIKYKTDVIPVSTVNAEYINPFSYNIEFISKIVNKVGMPFLPIGLSLLLVPLQPWAFYMAFPANLTYVRGSRIKPYEMVDKPIEALTKDELDEVALKVKNLMQQELDEAVAEYGKRPYNWSEFFKNTLSNPSKWAYMFPWGWPLMFLEHERQWGKGGGKPLNMKFGWFSWVGWLFKNPRAIWFFIPIIGWIPIVIRSLRDRD